MSNIQTGAERMPHDLSHLGFLAGQIGRLITISTTPVIAGDSFEMDAVGALRLSPLRRGLAIDSTVDIFTFYFPHRHFYGEQCIKFLKDGVNATPLPTVNTIFFFFNAAAPTEIYTLSLHDALPISSPTRTWRASTGPTRSSPSARGSRRRDRTSTRLKSRHVSISYAVFCLKNK